MWPPTIAATLRYQIAPTGIQPMSGARLISGSTISDGSQIAPRMTSVR